MLCPAQVPVQIGQVKDKILFAVIRLSHVPWIIMMMQMKP